MNDNAENQGSDDKKKIIKIQYEEMSAKYATQFVVNRNEECLLLGFSTGIVEDNTAGHYLLPIHSRIAISEESARKLVSILQDSLKHRDATEKQEARVPRIDEIL